MRPDENILSQRITLCKLNSVKNITWRHFYMSYFLVGLIVHERFVLFEGWTFSTLNITLQKIYHVIQVHA